MIHEVDESLRVLFRDDALEGSQIAVAFDAPSRDWAGKVNAPTVNVYLYDIREDMLRRERGLHNEYDAQGIVIARHRPPRYFKLSYLITAWTKRPEDEHRLLSSLLTCLMRHEALPPQQLSGSLAEIGAGVLLTVGLPPPQDRSFADVWSALGGELKPSLDLVVSVPVTSSPTYEAGPPTGEDALRLGFSGKGPSGTGTRTGSGSGSGSGQSDSRQRMPGGATLPVYGTRPHAVRQAPAAPGSDTTARRGGIASRVAEEPPSTTAEEDE
ncbi:DUF4255 domain-containing protein [Streptomyces sp. N2-109]|uniref:DUF4255 domain-containing protein n=1 Tax=Streptomyces gossypii TaxID=2883101 RepID=A0ABT2K157_9ACTN|nr:DUF4255 domain-containing protein [Streptomyces gossypii]MCT2593909.1 DUF4255 domain-containing protein [Streptomyces gossypii]